MADINGGGLSFTSQMDNSQLDSAIAETMRRVQGFTDAVVGSGVSMDETSAKIVKAIEQQMNVVNALEQEYADLQTQINGMQPGTAQDALIERAKAVKAELDRERGAIDQLGNQMNTMQQVNQQATESLDKVRAAIGVVGAACEMNETAIAGLETEMERLTKEMAAAYKSGDDAAYIAIKQRVDAIKGEIRVRQSLLNDLRNESNALDDVANRMETERKNAQATTEAHVSLRTQIRNLKEAMADYAMQFGDQTDQYREMSAELGRLQDLQSDIQSQGSILANDEAQFAGVMSGLQGVVGGFTAAQGAVALFAGENEDLQRIMLKVQSLMSITMGLQQASAALNKDSAFRLVTLNGLKEWWNKLLDVGRAKQEAENVAVAAGTVAQGANTTATEANAIATEANAAAHMAAGTQTKAEAAAKAAETTANVANTASQVTNTAATAAQASVATVGTAANIGLAGAFRMVGAAIKSIPVFGWIAAGISAIIAVLVHFKSKADEAKKAQEEFSKSLIDGCYKPIATINELSAKYSALGDNMEAKKKFIEDNRRKFEELGVAVDGVTDAENVLIANKDAFIAAQIAKAKALVYTQQAAEKTKELLEAQAKLEKTPKAYVTVDGEYTDGWGNRKKGKVVKKDSAWQEAEDEVNRINTEIQALYSKAYDAEQEELERLKQGGIEGARKYAEGTVGAIEQAIADKQAALKKLSDNGEYKKGLEEIAELQGKLDAITGKKKGTGGTGGGRGGSGGGSNKDAFLEKLSQYKNEYQRFLKWANSGDDILVQSAKQEFAGLLQQGATYIEYLQNQRNTILSVDVANRTKEQNKQLRQLNDAIAEETKKTVLESFNEELNEQLANARTVMEMLNIIDERRKELANDGTDVDNGKKDALDDAEKSAKAQQEQETNDLLKQYESYMAKKKAIDEQYTNDMALLQARRLTAATEAEKAEIDAAIKNRQNQYAQDSKTSGNENYDAMLAEYGTYEQKKQQIIDSFEAKRLAAQEQGDEAMVASINKAQERAIASLKMDELKLDPDYIRAFEDLDFASTATLEALVAKFEEAKESMAQNLGPEDLREYTDAITKMVEEINSRNLFGALKSGYRELKVASNELKAAEQNLADVRAKGLAGTSAESKAISAVNKAKDKYMRKNKEVRKSEKEVQGQIDELCNGLKELGDQIGGEAGEIISLIGDIGLFVTQTIDSVKITAKTGEEAISSIEKASVILAIISAAYQIATKIVSMFAGDDGTAAYEAAQKVYQSYVATLNEVIDAEMDLMNTMTGKDATEKLEYAISLLEKAEDAARTLGRQYLNAGASSGFMGIGSSASHGVKQRDEISGDAWNELQELYNKGVFTSGELKGITDGRMTGLFDLTIEQIRTIKKEAPLFFASLHEDTQEYLNDILEKSDKVDEVIAQYNETITGVSFDTMRDDFLEALQDMELDAKTISNNIRDYLRKALITDMFKRLYQDKLDEYYKQFAAALGEDSEDGTNISAKEAAALDSMREALVNGAVAATEKINEQFKDLMEDEDATGLSGAVQGVTEETADIIAGQMNAIRINQMEATDILRNQLAALNEIAQNTAYNRQLLKLDRIITLLESGDGALRSQGLS